MVNAISSSNTPQILNQENVQNTLAKSKQVVSDNFESNSAVKTISSTADDGGFAKAAPLVPVLYVVDKFLDGLMAGDTSKNILGKFAKVGDKISDGLHLERFLSEDKINSAKKKIAENRFTKYFTNTYKANPICSMAKSTTFAESMSSKLDEQAKKVLSQLTEIKSTPEGLNELLSTGVSEKTKQFIKDIAPDKSFSTKQILDVVDDFAANGTPIAGKDFSIVRNKAAAATSKIGNTTLGKLLSKGVVKTKDVATYGGGLLSMFFMASGIYNSIKAAKEAPEGEKKATFMHVLSEQYLGMILFQPSINLLYKAGGNKYRGMSETGRKALTDLITKTNADETLTKEGLKIAKLQRNLLIKGVDEKKVADLAGKGLKEAKTMAKSLKKEGAKLKFWEKPLKFMGTLLSTGLDKMKTPKFANIAGKKIKIPQPTLKGFVGGFGRFALIMFVIQPIIQKPVTKLFHKIFGEPKAYLAKQEAGNSQASTEETNASVVAAQNNAETNLLKKWTQPAVQEAPATPVQNIEINNGSQPQQIASTPIDNNVAADSQPLKPQQNDEIAALNLFNKDKKQNDSRYIPSIEPVQIQDNSKEIQAEVDAIIKRTDSVIKKTKNYL